MICRQYGQFVVTLFLRATTSEWLAILQLPRFRAEAKAVTFREPLLSILRMTFVDLSEERRHRTQRALSARHPTSLLGPVPSETKGRGNRGLEKL